MDSVSEPWLVCINTIPTRGWDSLQRMMTWPQEHCPMTVASTGSCRTSRSEGDGSVHQRIYQWFDSLVRWLTNLWLQILPINCASCGCWSWRRRWIASFRPEKALTKQAPRYRVGLSLLHTLFGNDNNFCDELKWSSILIEWCDKFLRPCTVNRRLNGKDSHCWMDTRYPRTSCPGNLKCQLVWITRQHVKRLFGCIGNGEILSGIIVARRITIRLLTILTEEFVSVYRLHPLIPHLSFMHSRPANRLMKKDFFVHQATDLGQSQKQFQCQICSIARIAHPGAITFRTPRFLQQIVVMITEKCSISQQ